VSLVKKWQIEKSNTLGLVNNLVELKPAFKFIYAKDNKIYGLFDYTLWRIAHAFLETDTIKDMVLDALSVIDNFTDCLIVTDFTKFTEDGIGESLQSGDTYTIDKIPSEMKIILTTSSTSGGRRIWVYKNLPSSVSAIWISCRMMADDEYARIDVTDADPSTYSNPPDFYTLMFEIIASSNDTQLRKRVSDTWTHLADEAVDLTAGTYYKVGFYIDVANGVQKVWRDSDPLDATSPTLSATDTDITNIIGYRFTTETGSTSKTLVSGWGIPLVIAWKV